MANKKSPLPEAGLKDEVERLGIELYNAKNREAKLAEKLKEKEDLVFKLNEENIGFKKSLEAAYVKIQGFEQISMNRGSGEAVKEGYVEIATMPYRKFDKNGNIENELYPFPSVIDSITIPRRKDEDGIMYEVVPTKVAIAQIATKDAFKRYLIGPCDKIVGTVPIHRHGQIYSTEETFKRHKKIKNNKGVVEFIEVTVEESISKAE
jgi:hypothetical protein